MTNQERDEKLDLLLKEFYIHATGSDDYGCKECLKIKEKIKQLFSEGKDSGLHIACDICHNELTEPGALFFSSPDKDKVIKKHICKSCEKGLFSDGKDKEVGKNNLPLGCIDGQRKESMTQ